MLDTRVHYRRKQTYNTRSNKFRKIKTPGGRILIHLRKKLARGVQSSDCGYQKDEIHGIPKLRPIQYARISKCKRTVARAYGGTKSARCVRDRILRAFLNEEIREMKKKALEKSQKKKKGAKKSKK